MVIHGFRILCHPREIYRLRYFPFTLTYVKHLRTDKVVSSRTSEQVHKEIFRGSTNPDSTPQPPLPHQLLLTLRFSTGFSLLRVTPPKSLPLLCARVTTRPVLSVDSSFSCALVCIAFLHTSRHRVSPSPLIKRGPLSPSLYSLI